MYMGIDPGMTGGIVILDADGKIVSKHKMPETLTVMVELFDYIYFEYTIQHCCVELVHAIPMDTPKTAFVLGNNFGRLEILLTTHRIPYETVTPTKWQNSFGLKKEKNEGHTSWKNRIRDVGLRIYGMEKKDLILQISDAAMIARYCYHLYGRQKI